MQESSDLCIILQLLKNAKSLRTDKSLELSTRKIEALETELKEANKKIKERENNQDNEDKTDKKVVRFGADIKKDSDTLKLKQDEVDKLKLNYSKVQFTMLCIDYKYININLPIRNNFLFYFTVGKRKCKATSNIESFEGRCDKMFQAKNS